MLVALALVNSIIGRPSIWWLISGSSRRYAFYGNWLRWDGRGT